MWKEFWNEVKIPSLRTESVYMWALIAAGHFYVGLTIAALAPGFEILVILSYVVLKEYQDYRRGGRLIDSAIDTTFLSLGVLGSPIAAAFLIAAGITFYRQIQRL